MPGAARLLARLRPTVLGLRRRRLERCDLDDVDRRARKAIVDRRRLDGRCSGGVEMDAVSGGGSRAEANEDQNDHRREIAADGGAALHRANIEGAAQTRNWSCPAVERPRKAAAGMLIWGDFAAGVLQPIRCNASAKNTIKLRFITGDHPRRGLRLFRRRHLRQGRERFGWLTTRDPLPSENFFPRVRRQGVNRAKMIAHRPRNPARTGLIATVCLLREGEPDCPPSSNVMTR